MSTFFTADLHIGHYNAIKFDDRPFASVEEMDAEIIRRWNNRVGPDDTVYILGDVIWKARNDDAPKILKQLNGHKILIKGNHDQFLRNPEARKCFDDIRDYYDTPVTLKDGTTRRCILSHYFIPMYNGHRYGAIHLHGHSHISEEAALEFILAEKLNKSGFKNEIYNVGCMYWDYEPVTLDEIIASKDIIKEAFGEENE